MKLNTRRTILLGLAFMSICTFWQMYDNIVPKIIVENFGKPEMVKGFVMSIDNILALFLLPLFGALSDKTNTRIGRRMPFIITGTVLAVVAMMFVTLADNTNNFVGFAVALGVVLIAMGTYRSPAVALMPDLTEKPLRSKANAIINLMGTVGGIFALLIMKFAIPTPNADGRVDYFLVFALVAAIMVICVVILFLTINEKKMAVFTGEDPDDTKGADTGKKMPRDMRRSLVFLLISVSLWFMAYNAVTTSFSVYTTEVWGVSGGGFTDYLLVATIAATIAYVPIGIISSRIGRKKVILFGVALLALMFATGFFFKNYSPLALIVFALVGVAWASINVNSYPMVVEMSRGSDIGKYTGYYYTFSMAAQVITPIFSSFCISTLGIGYRVLFPYAAIFAALAFVTMLFVRHGDVKAEAKGVLESFDTED